MSVSLNPSQGSPYLNPEQFKLWESHPAIERELAGVSENLALDAIRENPTYIAYSGQVAKQAKNVKEFVLILVEIDANKTAENIGIFSLSENEKLEVIRAIAKVKPIYIAWNIEKFDLQNEKNRYDIFLEMLDLDEAAIFTFPKYAITNRDYVCSILKKEIKKNPFYVTSLFSKFPLDEKDQQEFIDLIIATDPAMVCNYISQFNRKFHVSILKQTIIHASMPEDVMENVNIEKESDRFEIAKELLANKFVSASCVFKAFKFENQEYILTLAKMIAKFNPAHTVFCFKSIPLTEEKDRFEVAMQIAVPGAALGRYISHFKITNSAYKKAILEKLLVDDPDSFGFNMRNFLPMEEGDLFFIAMKLAKIKPLEACYYIESFKFNDPIRNKKFLQSLCKRSPVDGISNIVIHLPEDEKDRFEIARVMIRYNPALWFYVNQFKLSGEYDYQISLMMLVLKAEDARLCLSNDIFNVIQAKTTSELIAPLKGIHKKDRKKNPEKENWYSDCNLSHQYLKLYHNADIVNIEVLIEQLSLIVNPKLREIATSSVFSVLLDKKGLQYLKDFKGRPNHLLPLLLMAGGLKFKREDVLKKIENELVLLEKFFSDGKHFDQLLRLLTSIYNASLKHETVVRTLHSIFYPSLVEFRSAQMSQRTKEAERLKGEAKLKEEYYPRIKLLNLLVTLDKASGLNSRSYSLEELKELSKEIFIKEMAIDAKAIDDFDNKYKNHVAALKDESALFTYAGKIKQVDNPEALKRAYAWFVTTVLQDTFYTERYAKSPNLIKLAENVEANRWKEIIAEWKKGECRASADFQEMPEEKEVFDLRKFLYKRLLEDGHIVDIDKKFPVLVDYIQKYCTLEEALSRGSDLEKGILSLFVELSSEKIKALKASLKDQIFEDFQEDLNDLNRSLNSKGPQDNITIKDTDNVSHLLLMGRQTGGCQNIDGNPSSNKAALAYIIDGKNRLLGTFDDTDVLLARSVFRMLVVEDSNSPGLFLERYYSLNFFNMGKSKEMIKNFAINRARKLGLSLYSSEYTSSKRLNGALISVGSNAPFEYCDAAQGMSQDGIYRICNPYILYQPGEPKKEEA